MNFFLYILYSPTHNRTYTGQTKNLGDRLAYHNAGKVKSTKAYRPWVLIYQETYSTRAEAMKREK
jgi:putative endonuclease